MTSLDLELETNIEVFNDFTKPLPKRLLGALKSQILCDVTFVVGSDEKSAFQLTTPDIVAKLQSSKINEKEKKEKEEEIHESGLATKQEFKCNRLLLCICSPVFNAMLNTLPMKEAKPNSCVELPDDSPVGFRSLLEFAYSDNVNLSIENVFDTLQVASKYRVTELENLCCLYLQNQITWREAFQMLLKASNEGKRKQFAVESCLKVFWFRPPYELEEMFDSCYFLANVPAHLFIQMIQSDFIQLSEEHLWIAVLKWNYLQKNKDRMSEILAQNEVSI
ncbi:hypothetical protein RFI_13340, partial [Reticulomyxa filosa]